MGLPITASFGNRMVREIRRYDRWNLKDLGARLMIDTTSAVIAAGLVAPIVTVIDKYAFC